MARHRAFTSSKSAWLKLSNSASKAFLSSSAVLKRFRSSSSNELNSNSFCDGPVSTTARLGRDADVRCDVSLSKDVRFGPGECALEGAALRLADPADPNLNRKNRLSLAEGLGGLEGRDGDEGLVVSPSGIPGVVAGVGIGIVADRGVRGLGGIRRKSGDDIPSMLERG